MGLVFGRVVVLVVFIFVVFVVFVFCFFGVLCVVGLGFFCVVGLVGRGGEVGVYWGEGFLVFDDVDDVELFEVLVGF